jgi:DNA invertase Pin-like site-specific DNA recombinase
MRYKKGARIMPGYKRIPLEIKNEVLTRSKTGVPVVDLATQYGISTKTIYNWLGESSGNISHLEVAKLRKENEYLLGLVGRLTLESAKFKKKLQH